MEPFIVGVDITDVNQLYGRGREIETLISCAKRKGNAGIIGARRFGKTCLLKSLQTYLRNNENTEAYPLYFDVKTQCGVKKNTAAVFRTISSLLAAEMCMDALLPEGALKVSRRCSLEVSRDALDMRIQMEEWNPEYQKQVLFVLAKLLSDKKKYLLLLLDEIDYLLLEAFENPSDFSRVRGAATDNKANLKFWIAGTSSWSAICSSVGSPELNCGLENVTLTSLSKEEFALLWEKECSLIDDTDTRGWFVDLSDQLYAKTGGVPYFAKFVASHIYTTKAKTLPTYDIIRDYLCEIVNNRFVTDVERTALFSFAKGSKAFKDNIPDSTISLKAKGLVSMSADSTYYLSIGYLEDYLKACGQDKEEVNESLIEQKELNELVSQIERLRISVNKINGNRGQIFLSSDEDPIEFGILRKQCHDEASMDAFSGSLYKLYYEGSDKGNRLPYKWSEFSNLTRALRHMYNHRECEPSTMTEDYLLRIVNNGKHPLYESDFAKMQRMVLQLFRDELNNMLDNNQIQTHTGGTTSTNDNSSTLRGKINLVMRRIFVENTPPYIIDNKKGFASNNSPKEYDYSEGEDVFFELRETTNPKTGKPFAFAVNVRPIMEI